MSPILLGLVLFGVLLVLLALFAGQGATETVRPLPAGRPPVARFSLPELARALREILAARGFTLLSEAVGVEHADLLLKNASPLVGQTVYVRCVLPEAGGAVDSLEVQAALDRIRGEQLEKAIVVTTGSFSNEARLVASGTNVELIDGPALAQLLEVERRGGARQPLRPEPASL